MFKTRLPISKELIISLTLSGFCLLLLIINVVIGVTTVKNVYFEGVSPEVAQPIDANTVNAAIEILNE